MFLYTQKSQKAQKAQKATFFIFDIFMRTKIAKSTRRKALLFLRRIKTHKNAVFFICFKTVFIFIFICLWAFYACEVFF